jgi:hypothetical protein
VNFNDCVIFLHIIFEKESVEFYYIRNHNEHIFLQFFFQDQIILFLTDGLPTIGADPVRTIAEENKRLKNSVVIFTYGIGRCKYTFVFWKILSHN